MALDRVGEKTNGTVMVDGVEGIKKNTHIMPPQIGHQIGQIRVGVALDQGGYVALITKIIHQGPAPGLAALKGQGRIALVGAFIDPVPEPLATGPRERLLLPGTVFQQHHLPAHGGEQILNPSRQTLGDDAIQALPVIVNHPPGIA